MRSSIGTPIGWLRRRLTAAILLPLLAVGLSTSLSADGSHGHIVKYRLYNQIIATDLYGKAIEPLQISVYAEGGRTLRVAISGTIEQASERPVRDGNREWFRFDHLPAGEYEVWIVLLSSTETVIERVRAGVCRVIA